MKDVLDNITTKESNYLSMGIDNYLEKYEYATHNNFIDRDKYLLAWYEFNNEGDIVDELNGYFLVCVGKTFNLNNKIVCVDINSSVYKEISDSDYLYLGDIINCDAVLLYSLMNNLFKFKTIDNEIYI